jgi:hypothetical protein
MGAQDNNADRCAALKKVPTLAPIWANIRTLFYCRRSFDFLRENVLEIVYQTFSRTVSTKVFCRKTASKHEIQNPRFISTRDCSTST